jgi:hypothetical protein
VDESSLGIGSIAATPQTRRHFAKKSVDTACDVCGPLSEIIKKIPSEDECKPGDFMEQLPDDFKPKFKKEEDVKKELQEESK